MHTALLAVTWAVGGTAWAAPAGAPAAAEPPPAACPAPASSADLVVDLERLEAAWIQSDLPALQDAARAADGHLPCLREVVPRPVVARLHRDLGLRAFVDRDLERAELHFAAARALEPAWVFPESMVPAGNPLRDHYRARPADGPGSPVDPPREGEHSFDGRIGDTRPAGRPTLYQRLDAGGAVLVTALLAPEDPLPAFVPRPRPTPPEAAHPGPLPDPARVQVARLRLGVGAGAAALAAGGLLVVSRVAAGQYADPATVGQDELDRLRGTANGSLAASAGLGAAAVGLGVAALVVR